MRKTVNPTSIRLKSSTYHAWSRLRVGLLSIALAGWQLLTVSSFSIGEKQKSFTARSQRGALLLIVAILWYYFRNNIYFSSFCVLVLPFNIMFGPSLHLICFTFCNGHALLYSLARSPLAASKKLGFICYQRPKIIFWSQIKVRSVLLSLLDPTATISGGLKRFVNRTHPCGFLQREGDVKLVWSCEKLLSWKKSRNSSRLQIMSSKSTFKTQWGVMSVRLTQQ